MSSRRRRTRRGRGALAAGALVVAVAGAAAAALSSGLVVIDRSGDGRAAVEAPAAPRAPLAPFDTSAGTLDRAAPAPPPPAPTDSLPAGRAGDAAPITATAAELASLAARLTVPVAGVRPDQLVDSFDDARGGREGDGEGVRRHDALDILAPKGTPVVAATGGRVLKLFDSRAGGLTVYTTDESERFVLLYAHLDRYAPGLREGARVRQGETIGYVGATGNANPATPHLHFAIARTDDPRRWYGGTPVNPYPLLRGGPAAR